jgi:hypothetical protein
MSLSRNLFPWLMPLWLCCLLQTVSLYQYFSKIENLLSLSSCSSVFHNCLDGLKDLSVLRYGAGSVSCVEDLNLSQDTFRPDSLFFSSSVSPGEFRYICLRQAKIAPFSVTPTHKALSNCTYSIPSDLKESTLRMVQHKPAYNVAALSIHFMKFGCK